jgi:hypothetical protein
LIDEMPMDYGITAAVKEQTIGGCRRDRRDQFPVIALHVFGQVGMDDKPDIGFADFIPKATVAIISGTVMDKAVLAEAAHLRIEAGMVAAPASRWLSTPRSSSACLRLLQ